MRRLDLKEEEFKSLKIWSTIFFSEAKSYKAEAYLSEIRSPEANCDVIIKVPFLGIGKGY